MLVRRMHAITQVSCTLEPTHSVWLNFSSQVSFYQYFFLVWGLACPVLLNMTSTWIEAAYLPKISQPTFARLGNEVSALAKLGRCSVCYSNFLVNKTRHLSTSEQVKKLDLGMKKSCSKKRTPRLQGRLRVGGEWLVWVPFNWYLQVVNSRKSCKGQ